MSATEHDTAKMVAAAKATWLEALRSGNYQQGQYTLHRDGKFCCLGVLLHVHGIDCGNRKTPNGSEQERFGLTEWARVALENMNDGMNDYAGRQKNFSEIADWIDACL